MNSRRHAGTAISLLLACASLGAQQADRAQTEALARRAAERLAALHAEADKMASDERTLLGDLRRLELERQIRTEELRQVERETAQVATELAALDAQAATLEHQEQQDTPRLRARLVSLYKLGEGRYVRLLLSSDVRQMAQAARSVAALAAQDHNQVAQHQQRLAALRASRVTLDERRTRLAALRANAARTSTAAAEAATARNALIVDIDRRRDLNAQLAGELQGAQQQLQATLGGLAAGTAPAVSALPIGPFRGDLDWPLAGTLRQPFGRPTRTGAAVNGIDIAATEGAAVQAIHDGTVAFAGPFAGFAQLVIVDHGGRSFSLYGNLREPTVAQGDHVTRGQPVGTVGTSPTGAAGLYFELRIDGRPVDPVQMAQEKLAMSSSARRLVLWISAPVLAFAIGGGFLSKVTAREETFPHLRVFDDVVRRISDNYVEKADMDKVLAGAMHGLVDSLDPDSAVLTPEQVKQVDTNAALPAGDVGLDLTRQYYLRVIASRDGSPAAKAGIRTGDYVRIIGATPTREMSVFEGMRRLRGAPGSKISLTIIRGSTQDPHVVELTREAVSTTDVTSKIVAPGVGYLRVAAVGARTAEQAKAQIAELTKNGAAKLVVDLRRSSGGSLDGGLSLARLFVAKGTLASRETRGSQPVAVVAAAGDGAVTLPTTLLIDNGTSGAAELFASALLGNSRAELIGEHTIGRAATQRLVRLPDGSGLWLTTTRFLTPAGTPLHEKGLEPTVGVEEPDVEFGQTPPAADPILEKALERIAPKKAA